MLCFIKVSTYVNLLNLPWRNKNNETICWNTLKVRYCKTNDDKYNTLDVGLMRKVWAHFEIFNNIDLWWHTWQFFWNPNGYICEISGSFSSRLWFFVFMDLQIHTRRLRDNTDFWHYIPKYRIPVCHLYKCQFLNDMTDGLKTQLSNNILLHFLFHFMSLESSPYERQSAGTVSAQTCTWLVKLSTWMACYYNMSFIHIHLDPKDQEV